MTLTTTLLSSVNDNSSTVTINFDEMIEVSKEVVAFTFLQMVAEVMFWLSPNSIKMNLQVGGFIALILGVSFIDLFRILDHVQTKLVERLIGKNIFNSMFQ